jgi:hypothetical protein
LIKRWIGRVRDWVGNAPGHPVVVIHVRPPGFPGERRSAGCALAGVVVFTTIPFGCGVLARSLLGTAEGATVASLASARLRCWRSMAPVRAIPCKSNDGWAPRTGRDRLHPILSSLEFSSSCARPCGVPARESLDIWLIQHSEAPSQRENRSLAIRFGQSAKAIKVSFLRTRLKPLDCSFARYQESRGDHPPGLLGVYRLGKSL